MSKDCGCTKKVVDKIYVENSCCGNKEKNTKCNSSSCCTTCGKQIDLIDSDLYAENIYNYTENTTFNSNQVILLESEMQQSALGDTVDRDSVYSILQTTNNKTEILIQLRQVDGLYGLKCAASSKLIDTKYIVCYVKQYVDENILDESTSFNRIQNKDIPVRSIFCVYTNNGIEATFENIELTGYTCQEMINILNQYATQDWVENYVITYLNNNYYNQDYIDYKFDHIPQGESCLFKNGYNDIDGLSTQRKGDESEALGKNSFAIQGGKTTGENTIALANSQMRNAKNSLGFFGNIQEDGNNNNVIIMLKNANNTEYNSYLGKKTNNSINIGGSISNNSDSTQEKDIALFGTILNSSNSVSINSGYVSNCSGSISIGSGSKSYKSQIDINTNTSKNDRSILGDYYSVEGDSPNDEVSSNNISINKGQATGRYSIANGAQSIAVNEHSKAFGKLT